MPRPASRLRELSSEVARTLRSVSASGDFVSLSMSAVGCASTCHATAFLGWSPRTAGSPSWRSTSRIVGSHDPVGRGAIVTKRPNTRSISPRRPCPGKSGSNKEPRR
jgi:hypothetical protein